MRNRLTVLNPMNTNVTGFRCFSKIFTFLCSDESSLSIGRVKIGISNHSSRFVGTLVCLLAYRGRVANDMWTAKLKSNEIFTVQR